MHWYFLFEHWFHLRHLFHPAHLPHLRHTAEHCLVWVRGTGRPACGG